MKKEKCQKWESNPRKENTLRPERSALDRSAILTFSDKCYSILLCWLQLITV